MHPHSAPAESSASGLQVRAAVGSPSLPIEPIIPIGWRWLVGIYLGVPLLLVVMRPEIMPELPLEILRHYGVTVFATLGIGGLVHAVYAYPMPWLLPRIASRLMRLLVHAATIMASVMLGKALVRPFIDKLCVDSVNFRHNDGQELSIAVTAAMVVVGIASTYTQMQRKSRRIEQLEAEARQVALSARLEALRARTSPHFLFNSLNTVASLIPTDPVVAEETVERLADLFRYTLQSARRGNVKLADELKIVRDYLEIEQLRLGARLRYDIDIDPSLERLRVPPLIVQPLVENAVLHGIACKRRGGHIRVSVRRDADDMILQVEDEGHEPTCKAHAGTGTALADLERRIALNYGEVAVLMRERREHGYCVQLRLPLGGPQLAQRAAPESPKVHR